MKHTTEMKRTREFLFTNGIGFGTNENSLETKTKHTKNLIIHLIAKYL